MEDAINGREDEDGKEKGGKAEKKVEMGMQASHMTWGRRWVCLWQLQGNRLIYYENELQQFQCKTNTHALP